MKCFIKTLFDMKRAKTLDQLKAFMDGYLTPGFSTVETWNAGREEAKQTFSPSLINQLDASGYIKQCNLRPI